MRPLAYHITWGTYGIRLHGDPRGTVDRKHNDYKTKIVTTDRPRLEHEKARLKFAPVRFTREQRLFLETALPQICERGQWTFITCAVAPDHVHLIVKSEINPETIRRLAKRWSSEALFATFPTTSIGTWWAEAGSIRWIGDDAYLQNATRYVQKQRITPRPHEESRSETIVDQFDFDLRVD
jgi:REP element-mobilizing transposase RayT